MKKPIIILVILLLVIAASGWIVSAQYEKHQLTEAQQRVDSISKQLYALQTKLSACTTDSDCINSKVDTGGCYPAIINKNSSSADINELKNLAQEYKSLPKPHIGLDCPVTTNIIACVSNVCTFKQNTNY